MFYMVSVVSVGQSPPVDFPLRPGDSIRVGRDPARSDFACEQDPRISAEHFLLEFSNGRVIVRDLGSASGTLLNGEPVQVAKVVHGDELRAGATLFRFSQRTEVTEPAGAERGSAATAKRATAIPRPDDSVYQYSPETCESGLLMMRGGKFGETGQPPSPSRLAGKIGQLLDQYLIVDFRKAGLKIPESVTVCPLFRWLPSEVPADGSPQIVVCTPGDPELDEIIDAAWDQDAVICLYTGEPQEAVVEHLAGALKMDAGGRVNPEAKSMLGYCWPLVMSQLLSFRRANFVNSLLGGVDIVVTEIPDLPESWQVFVTAEGAAILKQAGFEESPCEAEVP